MATGRKTGGRKKGTPNKATSLGKTVISQLLADYSDSGLMTADFKALDPKDRLAIAEKLMQYVIPKMQATAIDLTAAESDTTLEQRLARLAEDNP